MGRATIAGGGTAGLYNVTVDYGATEIAAQVAVIDQQIADRQADLTDAVAAVAATDAAFTTAVAAADVAIDLYAADPTDERRQAMNAAAQELARISGERRVAEARRASLATIILSLQADKAQLQAVRTSETRPAWCVDYTEDATGEVATIEVPGEVGTLVIAPGGRSPTAADGKLVARGAQASHQVYYNAAILPGWQRFVHPYRVGTLAAKSGDTGTVNLDAALSSANDLQVRDELTIDAPIVYMTCNGEVFEPGDRVVVDMRGPTIIGFESNPRECPGLRIFEIELFTPTPQGLAFGLSGSVVGTCPGISTTGWQSERRYYFRQRLYDGTPDANPADLVPASICTFDRDAANYEGACTTGYFALQGATDIVPGQLQWFEVEEQINLDNTNVLGGRTMTATLGSPASVAGAAVFAQVTVDYHNLATGSLVRPTEESTTVTACLVPDSQAAQHQFLLALADLPLITYDGGSYQPVGVIRAIVSPAPQKIQDPQNFRLKVLYQRT